MKVGEPLRCGRTAECEALAKLFASAVALRSRRPRKHPDPATVGPLVGNRRNAAGPPAVASPAPIGHRPKGNPRAHEAHSALDTRGASAPRVSCFPQGGGQILRVHRA